MTDVTVNIRGDASQLRNEIDNVQNTTNDISGRVTEPARDQQLPPTSSGRIVDDRIENIVSSRRLISPSDINYEEERKKIESEISDKYSDKRDSLRNQLSSDYENIDEQMDILRKKRFAQLGEDKENDPFYQSLVGQEIDKERDKRYKRVGSEFDKKISELGGEEVKEKETANKELTVAIKELTENFKRRSAEGDPDSFIGRLKTKQRSLINERDSAKTEEEAVRAQKRLTDVNEKLKGVISSGSKDGRHDSVLQGSQGLMQALSSMQGGDISGAIMGGGSAVAGLSGMGMKSALRFLGWVGLAAGAFKSVSGATSTFGSMADLSAIRSTSGYQGKEASKYLSGMLPNETFYGRNISDFGFKTDEFATEASRRIKARGTSEDWFKETIRQVGLEGSLALRKGSLEQGGKYDRYGINVTDALTRLVDILDQIKGSGVSFSDFTRVQEKYDIQQQIMGSYFQRADKPSYESANQILSAFSGVSGITQDTRVGSDIQQFQNMIQNPMNERMKSLIYSTVSDLFPKTRGRLDLVDRELRDPKNEGEIMKAVVKRVSSQFGGTDTPMGYFAFKQLLPGITTDRRDKYINQISGEDNITERLLGGDLSVRGNEWDRIKKEQLSIEFTELKDVISTGTDKLVNSFTDMIGRLIGTSGTPTGRNKLFSGGNK